MSLLFISASCTKMAASTMGPVVKIVPARVTQSTATSSSAGSASASLISTAATTTSSTAAGLILLVGIELELHLGDGLLKIGYLLEQLLLGSSSCGS